MLSGMTKSRKSDLGLNQNQRHFGYIYKNYDEISNEDQFLVFDDNFYKCAPLPFEGKRVAIVGNGIVKGLGHFIDDHDIVVRLNYPYQWKRDPLNDGIRMTHWMGLAKNEVFNPALLGMDNLYYDPEIMNEELKQIKEFHCISHHHVQVGFFKKILDLRLADNFYVYFSTPMILDDIEKTIFGEDISLLSWITNRVYNRESYGGWFGWDILFTGVRTVLLAALSKPKSLSIFGMNFYEDNYKSPWEMHDISLNRKVLCKTGHISRMNNIGFEIYN